MEVRDAVRVPSDTEAAIRWRNAVGQRVVYLLPGTAQGMLPPGSRIIRTASVVDIGRLVSDLGPLTRSLDPDQINRLFTAAARSLKGNEQNIPRLLDNVNAITGTVNARKQTIAAAAQGLRRPSPAWSPGATSRSSCSSTTWSPSPRRSPATAS